MGRAELLFAECAVAVALLTGTACAIASADPTDTPAGEGSTSSNDQQPAPPPAADVGDTYSGDNDRTGGQDTTTGGDEESGDDEESADDQAGEDKPDDSGAPENRAGRPATKMPSKLPEAPPADIVPLPEELPPLPLEPPGDPDAVDVTMIGPGTSQSERNESPAMKLPAIIAPPVPPVHILGTSITARGTLRPSVTSPSRWPGEPLPPPRQPTSALRGPSVISTGAGQIANRPGSNKDGPPRVRWPDLAASALPGLSGIIVMTAAGICLGHRQASAANQLRAHNLDRFLA